MSKKKIYNVVFFEDVINVRIKEGEKSKIKRIVRFNRDVFMSDSHLVRCAVIKLLREYDEKGRRR